MKRESFKFLIFTFLISYAFSTAVWAARTAIVDVEGGADFLKSPDKTSEVLQKLKKGQKLIVSNYPTAGYFKARLPDGTLGWMRSDILELGPMPDLSQGKDSKSSD